MILFSDMQVVDTNGLKFGSDLKEKFYLPRSSCFTQRLSRNTSTGWCTNISGQAFRELDWSNCEIRLSPKGSGEFGMHLN
jgi:hypothetical protein